MITQNQFRRFALENGDSWGVQPEEIDEYVEEAIHAEGTWEAHVEECVKSVDAGDLDPCDLDYFDDQFSNSSKQLTAVMSDFREYLKASDPDEWHSRHQRS